MSMIKEESKGMEKKKKKEFRQTGLKMRGRTAYNHMVMRKGESKLKLCRWMK